MKYAYLLLMHYLNTCRTLLEVVVLRELQGDWVHKFHARHPNLKWAVPQGLDMARICQSNCKF